MSLRTAEVNAVDGYIDGSEGGEWVTGHLDYPVTEVAFSAPDDKGLPIYSDMRLLANQVSRMALSQEGDALIRGWHPSDWHSGPRDMGRGIHNFIEDSSCYWVQLLRVVYDGTADAKLVERQWPVLEKLMQWFLDRRTERGLVHAREFFLHFDNPIAFHECEGATLNGLVYGALADAAYLAERIVVTRHGPVPVAWKRTPDRGLEFTLSVPEATTAVLYVPRSSATSVLTVDGQTVSQPLATNRFLTTELRVGKHTGSVTL